MNIRWSRLVTAMLVITATVWTSDRCWAIRQGLGPSKDEWGLKYDVQVSDEGSDTLTVVFTLADEGRLKPFYSVDLVAFSKQTDPQGGRSYDVMEPIKLKATKDGTRVGEVQIQKEYLDRAKIRIITLTVDGKRQPSGGAFYDIPVSKYLNKGPGPSPLASPPASKVRK
ncbi:MAG TPA: hypothetical protein VL175_04770 [Pirellulales bacterium]|jgi:hypothetical protein|nr:hypothetical protein [Pirellulales bacterium]